MSQIRRSTSTKQIDQRSPPRNVESTLKSFGEPLKVSDDKKFKDAAVGYGFQAIEQESEGIYCEACLSSHKRPTKMYANAPKGNKSRVVMCKSGVIYFYWHIELSE